jgi:uncharacterized protein YndB with AHSA1/START domain
MANETDRIQKKVLLRASPERVWSAIGDAKEFGRWFGAVFDGPFVAGTCIGAKIAPTKVDAEVAKMQEPYAGMKFDVAVERVEPMRALAFRWHPAMDNSDPMTLVTFELEEAPGGTLLTITESGFDRIPLERRAKAFTENEQGWAAQIRLVEKYVSGMSS